MSSGGASGRVTTPGHPALGESAESAEREGKADAFSCPDFKRAESAESAALKAESAERAPLGITPRRQGARRAGTVKLYDHDGSKCLVASHRSMGGLKWLVSESRIQILRQKLAI